MIHTLDNKERNNQEELLKKYFADYDPKHHDYFVSIYNKRVWEGKIKED